MAKIPFKNFNMGGIADSDYMGGSNSMADLWGFDIHSEVGIAKVNQALTKESGAIVDEFVRTGVSCTDGNTYLFGNTTGKIWKRDSAGTYTLEATAATGAILEAMEYDGYIYYATANALGRWQVGTAWSTRTDSWHTFSFGDPEFHPMKVLNLVLYIGDQKVIAQVDAGTWSAEALDIPYGERIKCLGQLGTDLLMGTYVKSNVISSKIYRWNTWSVSYTNTDPIPEVGINAFIPIDNGVIVNAGTKGNFYIYDGTVLEPYKQLKGTWDNTTNKGQVNPNAVLNFNGLPLFGLSKISGSPANMGIYSMGRANRNYPIVLNGEQGISTGNLNNVEIGAILGVTDGYIVTWRDTNSGTVVGVDKLDLTLKYPSPYMTTRIIVVDRMMLMNYGKIEVAYRQLPESTGFALYKKVNNGSFAALDASDKQNDTDRNVYMSEVDISSATSVQVKIAPIVVGNTAPDIEQIAVSVNN